MNGSDEGQFSKHHKLHQPAGEVQEGTEKHREETKKLVLQLLTCSNLGRKLRKRGRPFGDGNKTCV